MKDDDEDDGRLFFLTRASLPLIVQNFILRMSFTQFFFNFAWPAFRAQRVFSNESWDFLNDSRTFCYVITMLKLLSSLFLVGGATCDLPRYHLSLLHL
jgi:hypothetical protein